MIRIAANLTMLYNEYDFFDRFAVAAEDGFQAVEFFFPYPWPAEKIRQALEKQGQQLVLFNMPLGDWDAGDRGFAGQAGRVAEYQQGVSLATDYGRQLHPPRINCPSGPAEDTPESWSTLKQNFEHAAESLKAEGIRMVVEPINHNDVPRALLSGTEQTVRFLDSLNTDNLWVQYDLYHSLRAGEDPFKVLPAFIDRIDHIQIADVPGRHQPGTGDVDFEKLFSLLEQLNYQGWTSMEYHPQGDTRQSFSRLREMGLLPR